MKDKTLLAVDDEQSILMIIDFVFGKKFNVVQKSNGMEAMAYLNEGNIPDIIIADLNMPEMNGFEFIENIRASGFYRNVPMIMLSGNEDTKDKVKALKAGADDYLVKPFNPEELDARIENIFRLIQRSK